MGGEEEEGSDKGGAAAPVFSTIIGKIGGVARSISMPSVLEEERLLNFLEDKIGGISGSEGDLGCIAGLGEAMGSEVSVSGLEIDLFPVRKARLLWASASAHKFASMFKPSSFARFLTISGTVGGDILNN